MELEKQLATAQEKNSNLIAHGSTIERKVEELQQEQLHWEGENRRIQDTVSVLEKGLTKKHRYNFETKH